MIKILPLLVITKSLIRLKLLSRLVLYVRTLGNDSSVSFIEMSSCLFASSAVVEVVCPCDWDDVDVDDASSGCCCCCKFGSKQGAHLGSGYSVHFHVHLHPLYCHKIKQFNTITIKYFQNLYQATHNELR